MNIDETPTPAMTSFFGLGGAAICMILASLGSAYGMAKAGVAVTSIGILHPDKIVKSLIPVVMAGMLGIYGVLIAIVLITSKIRVTGQTEFQGVFWFCGSIGVGLTSLVAGLAIGLVGDSGVRLNVLEPRIFTPMIVILVFCEALAIFGLIIGMITTSRG